MCGICGKINYENQKPVDSRDIRIMTAAMQHRGPDDEGYYVSGPVGLGFRRLSIIDLSGGHQPMSDRDKSVWVIFNGEIYNFHVIREQLQARGHVFRTKSDTEVIVHGYKEWGVDVLDHLNGMFGLAVWDVKKRRLMLARDRMGIKPLYYSITKQDLSFSSEIKPLLKLKHTKPGVDTDALYLFLRYRYTPSPFTLFEGIKKLAPGTRMILENGTPRVERWWNYKPVPFDPMPSVKEAEDRLQELYMHAVERHLISDVPLGLLLSGGLDSGLLLGMMSRFGKKWNTYSIGFGKEFFADELAAARGTADVFGAPNHAVCLDKELFLSTMPGIIRHLEEPIGTPSVVAMYHVCRRARQDVKAVFMGQGPDELFGGYIRHLGVRYGQYWRLLPEWVRIPLGRAAGSLTRNESVKRGMHALASAGRMERYNNVFSLMPGGAVHELFRPDVLPADVDSRIFDCWEGLGPLMGRTDELGGFQFLEVRSSLPDELLMYADKLSMAHGLEVRLPYLDREIVEYVERLDGSFKVRFGSGKWLHRRVCGRFLPSEITRRRKYGFLYEWRESIMDNIEGTLLHDSMITRYLRPEAVKTLISEQSGKRQDHSKILISLYFLEEWMRTFIGAPADIRAAHTHLRSGIRPAAAP